MRFSTSPCIIARDGSAILNFVHHHPDSTWHVIDLPYRLCSPSAQEPDNGQLWSNEAGELIGFCIIQRPFATIDCVVDPAHASLKENMIGWAMQRLKELTRDVGSFGFLYDSLIEDDPLALQHGFTRDDWDMRHLARDASQPIAEASVLPDGFSIRALNGAAEVEQYVDLHRAAFESRNMTAEWRARTLEHPLYQPDLDLVIEAADGSLAAFCIGWLAEVQGILTAQIEPLGVLPAYHRMGLGRAILEEMLRRMQARGAVTIRIDAESVNDGSQGLYEVAGFREVGRTLKYFRRIERETREWPPSTC